jgi:RNA polymerase sigma-70 factor (ECF subfamily)
MPSDSFSARLDAARAGDQAAWAELYGELAPSVLGYLRSNSAPDPEDTMSEAFLQVARDIRSFEGDERQFRAWVFTVAHHRLIDARRRVARRPVDLMAEPPEAVPRAIADEAADEALARIDADEVRELLAELSEDQRTVLLLRILGDMAVDDVAAVLGKRPGAVKQLQRRGLAAVRRELAKRGVTR